MKFQNCILINFVMDSRTHAHTDKPKTICPFNFSKVWGFSKVGGIKHICQIINSSFEHPKHMLKIMGKKIFKILRRSVYCLSKPVNLGPFFFLQYSYLRTLAYKRR